ncbi:MAG: hypothetical protein OHK0048_25440 [Rhodoferax sp.]
MDQKQRGGTLIGFALGLLVGLALALAVAVYVTKVPVPFVSRGLTRDAIQDVVESKKNKNWDPNAPLYGGKSPARAASGAASGEAAPAAVPAVPSSAVPVAAPVVAASGAAKAASAAPTREVKSAGTTDPLGDLMRARTAASGGDDPFRYFVQVGAFRTAEDAESQRARLSLAGIEARVSEREQAGRPVFRVRVGPFDTRDLAEQAKTRLDAQGLETALVRVQR